MKQCLSLRRATLSELYSYSRCSERSYLCTRYFSFLTFTSTNLFLLQALNLISNQGGVLTFLSKIEEAKCAGGLLPHFFLI